MRLAFFPSKSDSASPEYEMSMLLLHNGIAESMQIDYGDFTVNAVVVVITDGQDNRSKVSLNMVADALKEARTSEALESIMPILIGVGTGGSGSQLDQYLEDFKTQAGFQQYVGLADANEKTLAKLGGFISKSISSQSKSLGSGGASQSLTF